MHSHIHIKKHIGCASGEETSLDVEVKQKTILEVSHTMVYSFIMLWP